MIEDTQLQARHRVQVEPIDGLPCLQQPQEMKAAVQRAYVVVRGDDRHVVPVDHGTADQVTLPAQRCERQAEGGKRRRTSGSSDQDRPVDRSFAYVGCPAEQAAHTALQLGDRRTQDCGVPCRNDCGRSRPILLHAVHVARAISQPQVVAVLSPCRS